MLSQTKVTFVTNITSFVVAYSFGPLSFHTKNAKKTTAAFCYPIPKVITNSLGILITKLLPIIL